MSLDFCVFGILVFAVGDISGSAGRMRFSILSLCFWGDALEKMAINVRFALFLSAFFGVVLPELIEPFLERIGLCLLRGWRFALFPQRVPVSLPPWGI